jgi:hypothetical protein
MNQFFDIKRFSLLVSKHWADNKKRYALSVLAYLGLLMAWFVFTTVMGDDMRMSRDVQIGTYFFSLFVMGTLYASQYYRHLGSRAKGINFLLVPASTFEKFLCSLLYTVLLFFVVLTAAFYAIDFLMVTLSNAFIDTASASRKAIVTNVFELDLLDAHDSVSINSLLFFFALQATFLLGSVYFNKYNFLKTIICLFILFLAIAGFIILFHDKIFPDDRVPGWMLQLLANVIKYVIAPVLWIFSYISLKRKQV